MGRFTLDTLRSAAAVAIRSLHGRAHIGLTLANANGDASVKDIQAVAEGALLGAYRFDRYRRDANRTPVATVTFLLPDERVSAGEKAAERARVLATAVNLARDLVNMPANELYPASFANLTFDKAMEVGLAGEILDEVALDAGGYGGILAVGAGSVRPPRMARFTWTSPNAVTSVALVGKGVTFDSGGLSLKSRDGMRHQKKDMVGAATVFAATVAAAALALPLKITTYLPMAENMPSGSAYRPGDILRMRNGLHVEVVNTDAEGRLLLADGLARACEDSPDLVLSVAGLTGAQRVALGYRVSGVMGEQQVIDQLVAAGDSTGETIWPMPLPDDIPTKLESDIADIAGWHADSAGGMLLGGLFLSRFITERIPWAHLDIAGPAYNTGTPHGYVPTGATGTPVRAVIQFLEELALGASVCDV